MSFGSWIQACLRVDRELTGDNTGILVWEGEMKFEIQRECSLSDFVVRRQAFLWTFRQATPPSNPGCYGHRGNKLSIRTDLAGRWMAGAGGALDDDDRCGGAQSSG